MSAPLFNLQSCSSSFKEEGVLVEFITDDVACSDEEKQLWGKFADCPPIPGFLDNFIIVFRKDEDDLQEEADEDDPSILDVNADERQLKDFGFEICQYLLRNGVGCVQLLSNLRKSYLKSAVKDWDETKQDDLKLEVLNDTLASGNDSEDDDSNVDVTVVLLQKSYLASEQKKMFRIVQSAFSESTLGVIIVANSNFVSEMRVILDPKWLDFITYIRDNQIWRRGLEIVCARHKVKNNKVFDAHDLREASPLGGCVELCGKMKCGHRCSHFCHPEDRDHISKEFRCNLPCERTCPNGHSCEKACYEDCDECLKVVTLKRTCDHFDRTQKQVFCYEEKSERCQTEVVKSLRCGHEKSMKCWEDPNSYDCEYDSVITLPCGHYYLWECAEDIEKIKCQMIIVKKLPCGHEIPVSCEGNLTCEESIECRSVCSFLMKCGHRCERKCHGAEADHSNLKCLKPCNRLCARNIHRCEGDSEHLCGDPCKPCEQLYEYKLICGHATRIPCSSPAPDENHYECHEACMKTLMFCNHACPKQCWEECGPCEQIVLKRVPQCSRYHSVRTKCQDKAPVPCIVPTPSRNMSACGHPVKVPCHEADLLTPYEVANYCVVKCTSVFEENGECGHICRGNCKDCSMGRFHVRCKEPCEKELICGHRCKVACSLECPPCTSPCINFCEHQTCKLECGVPCEWRCEEPCTYECKHSKCTRKCSEVCNKKLCNEPCPEKLKCGHPCAGICGEKCPPNCRICDPSSLMIGVFSGKIELDSDDRFIFIEECKHSVEVDGFENWLRVRTTLNEILPIQCPICRTRIKWIRRYSAVMSKNAHMINSVRQKIHGDPKEIEEIWARIVTKLESCVIINKHGDFVEFRKYILDELKDCVKLFWSSPITFMKIDILTQSNLSHAKFMEWLTEEFVEIVELVEASRGYLPSEIFKDYAAAWIDYLNFIVPRKWPLHPNELRAWTLEKKRIEDFTALCQRLSTKLPEETQLLVNSGQGERLVNAVTNAVFKSVPYTKQNQDLFRRKLEELDAFLKTTLSVSDVERREILTAFGGTAGRWFKCRNGHIYVITECGGATEVSACPECGVLIGGENHVLIEGNFMAPEMDGADAPLYPTVLDRPNDPL